MHSVRAKLNFGIHGLKVRYNDGTGIVDGFIVKQKSHARFRVCSNKLSIAVVKPVNLGSGLTNGTRTFTVIGGTGTATTFVATVAGGSVVASSIVVTNRGVYTAAPANVATNLATVDTGSSNATFALTVGPNYTTVKLAPTLSLATTLTATTYNPFVPGYFTILVTPLDLSSGAAFVTRYVADAVAVTSGGTGYTVGDVLTVASGSTFTVTAVSAGVVTAATIKTVASVTTKPSMPMAVTGGTGTGATLTTTYKIQSVSVSGGQGYIIGQTLSFTGVAGATAHISAVNANGAPTAVVVDTPGAGITTFATAVVAASEAVQHVKKIYATKLLTCEGNTFTWSWKNNGTKKPFATVTLFS